MVTKERPRGANSKHNNFVRKWRTVRSLSSAGRATSRRSLRTVHYFSSNCSKVQIQTIPKTIIQRFDDGQIAVRDLYPITYQFFLLINQFETSKTRARTSCPAVEPVGACSRESSSRRRSSGNSDANVYSCSQSLFPRLVLPV